jgi:hypothetical protein
MHQDINIRGIDAQRPELGDLESDTALQIMLAYFLCNYIILSLHCVTLLLSAMRLRADDS